MPQRLPAPAPRSRIEVFAPFRSLLGYRGSGLVVQVRSIVISSICCSGTLMPGLQSISLLPFDQSRRLDHDPVRKGTEISRPRDIVVADSALYRFAELWMLGAG